MTDHSGRPVRFCTLSLLCVATKEVNDKLSSASDAISLSMMLENAVTQQQHLSVSTTTGNDFTYLLG